MDDVKPETISCSDVRAELARLRARYDGAIPQAVFAVVRALETELAWIEHRENARSTQEVAVND